jgi:nitrate reductase beta subunit
LEATETLGGDNTATHDVFHAITALRIPVDYLAQLFTAGDVDIVAGVLLKLSAMRTHMRNRSLGQPVNDELLAQVGMEAADIENMYRLLAIAKYEHRYVIPPYFANEATALTAEMDQCSVTEPSGPVPLKLGSFT